MFSGLNHHGLYLYVEGSVDNMQAHCKVDRIVFRSALAQPRVSGCTRDLRSGTVFSYTGPPPGWQNIPKIHFDHGKINVACPL